MLSLSKVKKNREEAGQSEHFQKHASKMTPVERAHLANFLSFGQSKLLGEACTVWGNGINLAVVVYVNI